MMLRHRFERAAHAIVEEQPYPPRRFAGTIILYALFDIMPFMAWSLGGLGLMLAVSRLNTPNLSDVGRIQAIFGYICGIGVLLIPIYAAWSDLRALRIGQVGTARIVRITQRSPVYTEAIATIVSGRYEVQSGYRTFEQGFSLARHWGKDLRPGTVMTVLVHPDKPEVLLALAPALDG